MQNLNQNKTSCSILGTWLLGFWHSICLIINQLLPFEFFFFFSFKFLSVVTFWVIFTNWVLSQQPLASALNNRRNLILLNKSSKIALILRDRIQIVSEKTLTLSNGDDHQKWRCKKT